MSKFNVELAWSKLLNEENPINVFIGVPTIFSQLIDYSLKNKLIRKDQVKEILKRKMRFIGSGSAKLYLIRIRIHFLMSLKRIKVKISVNFKFLVQ